MPQSPTFRELYGLFPAGQLPVHETISADEIPQVYRPLLDHTDHMTVTLDRLCGAPVSVEVLASGQQGDHYARHILLWDRRHGLPVQFGAVRIDFSKLTEPVRTEILSGQTPLGRVLTQRNLLCRVQPTDFLRVIANPMLARWLELPAEAVLYGRVGLIHADEEPVIEMLELLSPRLAVTNSLRLPPKLS